MTTTAAKVETVVMHTDRGTSALARKVTTLDATPPGQHATMQILHRIWLWAGLTMCSHCQVLKAVTGHRWCSVGRMPHWHI